jgi:hypothetical protein
MFSWPTFVLDDRPFLLLKSRKNSNISFFSARIRNKGCLRCNFEYGAGDISLLKSTFLQNRLPLNLHSAKYIAMNPRYVQPRDDTELVVS